MCRRMHFSVPQTTEETDIPNETHVEEPYSFGRKSLTGSHSVGDKKTGQFFAKATEMEYNGKRSKAFLLP